MNARFSRSALAFLASTILLSTTAASWPSMQDIAPDASTVDVRPVADQNLRETPASAERFINSIGIDSTYQGHKVTSLATRQLLWSGIHHLRDSGKPYSDYIEQMKYLGQHGIYHSIIMPAGFAISDLRDRLKTFAPYVDMVEPKNEADYQHNWSQMRSDQRNLWNTVQGNSAWKNILVAGPSFYNPGDHGPLVGPLDNYEDVGNLHTLPCDFNPGVDNSIGIEGATLRLRATTRYKPIITTEGGYDDNMKVRSCALTDDAIAKYIPRTSTERWLHGEPRTYYLFLLDNKDDIRFGNMGLLHSDGSMKPQFYALGNLVRLLSDPGSAPKSTSVSYTISGATADVHHILLARRDGTYDLIIYREVASWDHRRRAPVNFPADKVHLTVRGMKRAEIFSYNENFSFSDSKLAISKNYETANFPVTDTISVVHIGY